MLNNRQKDHKNSLMKDIIAGAKQSGNCHFPKIKPLKGFKEALSQCPLPKVMGAVPQDNLNKYNNSASNLSLWVGPEGGFSKNEKNSLKEAGCQAICIGEHILRVETATIGLLSILNH